MHNLARHFAVAAAMAASISCENGTTGPSPVAGSGTFVLVGAGDIAECGSRGTKGTAALLDTIQGTVFTTGDNAYPHGATADFDRCYDPTWGRHKSRTYPVPGNADYEQTAADPYFTYFGSRAGPRGLGYYSYDLGPWHIVALNSVIPATEGSAQLAWLRNDLAANPARCLAAVWHHPIFTSAADPVQPAMQAAWRVLQQAGAEFVVTGHDHVYERFGPSDDLGHVRPEGIRQFIVGTGGARLDSFGAIHPASEVRAAVWGVIKFTLDRDTYAWQFMPIAGESFTDSGTVLCH